MAQTLGKLADRRGRIRVFGALYLRGSLTRPASAARQLAFWAGFGLLYAALHTRLDYYSEHEFFVHRLQHLVLHHLGPFFIALSHPGTALRSGLSLGWRIRSVAPDRAQRGDTMAARVPAESDHRGVPLRRSDLLLALAAVHFDAMLDARLYRAMNWSMAIDGLLFWWLILDPRPCPPARLAPGLRIILAFL